MKRTRLQDVSDAPKSAGKGHLIRHLQGEKLTQRQAILAKCCDCMGYFTDGRSDCSMKTCSLHPYMPYREKVAVRGPSPSATKKERSIAEMPLRPRSTGKTSVREKEGG
jgi:hypothetical protein